MDLLIQETINYLLGINIYEAFGLIFGLLCVFFLIKENMLTWPTGIIYIIFSIIIFWEQQLYGDLILHIIFLSLNIYGWYYWVFSKNKESDEKLYITRLNIKQHVLFGSTSIVGILLIGYFLSNVHIIWPNLKPASLPYWDAATTALSITAMWLTAEKKIENWIYWLVIDVLAAGIYYYKGIFFYALLYFVYIALAFVGYIEWKRIEKTQIS